MLLTTRMQQAQVAKHLRQAKRSMCLCSIALLLLASSRSGVLELLRVLLLLVVVLPQSVLKFSLLQRLGKVMLLLPRPAIHTMEVQQPGRVKQQLASASSNRSPAVKQQAGYVL
jgi:hypothetical protein